MSERNRVKLRMVHEDGTEFSTWDGATLGDNYTDPLGSYSFTVTPPRARVAEYDDAFAKGSIVKVYLDDALQATIVITTKVTTIGPNGVTFQIQGKTLLCTAYEGSVDPDAVKVYAADTKVTDVIEEVMAVYGFFGVVTEAIHDVAMKTGQPLPTWDTPPPKWKIEELKHKEAQPQPGETAYGYCSRICSRVGAIMHVTPEGLLVLSRPIYKQGAAYSVVGGAVAEGADMMFGEISITDTNDGQFSEVVVLGEAPDVKGQKRANRPASRMVCEDNVLKEVSEPPATPAPTTAVKPMKRKTYRAWVAENPGAANIPFKDSPGSVFDQSRARYRGYGQQGYKSKILVDKRTRDQETAARIAVLAMSSRAANAYQIKCTLDGAKAATGRIWAVNTVVTVKIPILGIDEDMWVLERQLSVSRGNAQVTSLTIIPKNALLLDAAYA